MIETFHAYAILCKTIHMLDLDHRKAIMEKFSRKDITLITVTKKQIKKSSLIFSLLKTLSSLQI